MWAEGVKYQGGEELKYEVGEKGLNISPEEACGTLWGRKGFDIKRLNTKQGRLNGGGKGLNKETETNQPSCDANITNSNRSNCYFTVSRFLYISCPQQNQKSFSTGFSKIQPSHKATCDVHPSWPYFDDMLLLMQASTCTVFS